jgi:acyl-CoA synthetase (AMP-forming)/AMP-acid ligase II
MIWQNLDLTWHWVEKWAAEKPDSEALVFEDQRLTWREFKEQMDLAAKALLEAGIAKGDRVAMLSMARNEFPITYMAANKIGAMWLGLSPKFTLDELRFLIGDSKPSVLITLNHYLETDLTETVKSLMGEFDFLKKVLVIGGDIPGAERYETYVSHDRKELDDALAERVADVSPQDEALIMYTSGSTGKPKGVVHTHQSIVENIKVEARQFYFDDNTRILLHFPINHVAADVEIGFGGIMAGGCLVMMDKFDPAATLEIIGREKITDLGQIPVMFLLEFKDPAFGQADLSSIRQFLWAGAAAPKIMLDVLGAICQKTGARMLTGYGSTEVAGFVTYTEPGDDMDTLMRSAGKIADEFELKIVDEQRNELPQGQTGEIAVRGPFMMKEYFNNPQATQDVLDADGWYYTADLAYTDERGYIYIQGRSSEMYKSGGENVYPREIEDILETHPAVLFAAVLGVPDEIYQEVGWAFIMLKPEAQVSEDDLQNLCREKLANFKVPKRFFVRPLLPLLANGKINKMALKDEVPSLMES